MILATSDHVVGYGVARTLGLARGNSIRSRHMGHDIMALFRNMVGGEIPEYTKMLAEAREQALDRMSEEAESLGANAVVEIRFTTSMLMGGAAELLAYGTAVILVEDPSSELVDRPE